MRRVLLVHGPNLNLLGVREPAVYGSATLEELEKRVVAWGAEMGIEVAAFQSNHEGALIDRIHAARTEVDGLVINAGALTHYSYALADAITAVGLPAVEVHLSNIVAREPWRRRSVTAPSCLYTIFGRGVDGYRSALRVLRCRSASPVETVRYGDHDDQLVDLRIPDGPDEHRGVVLLHGGFWRAPWTRDTIDELAADLAAIGHLTANVEYRRLGNGGGWPQSGDDVLAAIETVADRPEVIAGSVVLVGHSAGGQLALWAAARTKVPLAGVIALAPVADLVEAHRRRLDHGIVERFLGGDPRSAPDAYADASPAARPAVGVPQVIVHGSDDEVVPIEVSRGYVAAAEAAGATVTLLERDGVGHDDVADPEHPAWSAAWESMTRPI